MNITGPTNMNIISIDEIDHFIPKETSIQIKILAWISLILINLSNGYLIYVIKTQMRSALDWLILMDSILCILSCISIIRLGILGPLSTPFCFIITFFSYFISVSNKLITMSISIYRYVFVVHYMKMREQINRKIFNVTLFSLIIFPSIVLTGFCIYYRDEYINYQRKVSYGERLWLQFN